MLNVVRDRPVGFRLTPAEYAAIQAQARQAGFHTVSAFIRDLLLHHLAQNGTRP